jgi:hypothetical protein
MLPAFQQTFPDSRLLAQSTNPVQDVYSDEKDNSPCVSGWIVGNSDITDFGVLSGFSPFPYTLF